MRFSKLCLSFLILLVTVSCQQTNSVSDNIPSEADSLLTAWIAEGNVPGAVVAWVTPEQVLMKAYGNRQWLPDTLPMTLDTQFDLASLSKVTSTGMCVFRLIEEGRVRLNDSIQTYLPDYAHFVSETGQVARAITIADLMTHTSGLPAYASWITLTDSAGPIADCENQTDAIARRKQQLRSHIATSMLNPPGEVCRYSCLNFITLQYVVETVTGLPLNEYAEHAVFSPLGMTHTTYYPIGTEQAVAPIVAPTEYGVSPYLTANGSWHPIVHDPLAREMNGGVSGNAGVFSTASDLVLMVQWMLGITEANDAILRQVQQHALWYVVPDECQAFGRAYAWDCCSNYAGCKGDSTSLSAICHTGYTGTSIVVDPEKKAALILLTNRVHPSDGGAVSALRRQLADMFFSHF